MAGNMKPKKNSGNNMSFEWDRRAIKEKGLRKVMSIGAPLDQLEARSKKEIKNITNIIKNLDVRTILDYGCGIGRLTGSLSKKWDIIGADISREMLKIAKKTYPDVQFLPIEKIQGIFDLVLTYTVLQHIPDSEIDKVLQNIQKFSGKYVLFVESLGKRYQGHIYLRPLEKYILPGFTLIQTIIYGAHTIILEKRKGF